MGESIEQMAVVHAEQQAKDLALLDKAKVAIEEATTIDEVRSIRDHARALEAVARRVEYGEILQQRCTAIKLRAERKAGELLRSLNLSAGRPGGNLTLGDMNISKNESSRWQRIADIPESDFESKLEDNPSEREMLRLAAALTKADEPEPAPQPDPEPTPPNPDQPVTSGYWVLAEGEGLNRVSDAAGVPVVALLDGDGVVAGYFLDQKLAEKLASILNAM